MKALFLMLMALSSIASAKTKFAEGAVFKFKKNLNSCSSSSTYIVEGQIQCSAPLFSRSCLVTGNVRSGQVCHLSSSQINNGLHMRDMQLSPSVTCPLITCSNNMIYSLTGHDALSEDVMREMLGDVVEVSEANESYEEDLSVAVDKSGRENRKSDVIRELEGNGIIYRRPRAIRR